MRIIAGKFRGRNLVDSLHLKKTLRPTTDMAREALFNILFSAKSLKKIGFELVDANVLDLCCGTGAVAFEALSRGAKFVTLIDNDRTHLELAKQNAALLKVESEAKILQLDARKLPQNTEDFDLIFIDPPYREDYEGIVKSLLEKNWIQKKSLVVIEFDSTSDLKNISELLKEVETRNYGKTSFGFFTI
jgi:16S rRNA (guanine966-N2)-methyltransferase